MPARSRRFPSTSRSRCCGSACSSSSIQQGDSSVRRTVFAAVLVGLVVIASLAPWATPSAPAQGVDVYINVTGGGSKKLNIALPTFTVVSGTDASGHAKMLAGVTGNDLPGAGLFSVVAAGQPVQANHNGSINLMPVWSPDARSIAFTSFMNGYPDLFRMFPFEPQRPVQTLAAFSGINSSPAWSPDGRFLALTLSMHGNPEIYVLTVATGKLERLTRHASIDTEDRKSVV